MATKKNYTNKLNILSLNKMRKTYLLLLFSFLYSFVFSLLKFVKNAGISCTSNLIEGDEKQNVGDFIFDFQKNFDNDLFMIMTKKEELSLSKNISVTARYIINNSPIPVINIRPKERKHITGPTTAF